MELNKNVIKYSKWYNFFSFWVIIWFVLFKLKIIKIPPTILFFYFATIFIIIIIIVGIVNRNRNIKINNVLLINIIIGIIVDTSPILYLNNKNLFNFNEIILMLIYFIIYLIFIKLRFKNEKNIIEIIYNIYFKYNNLHNLKNITPREYFKIKFNI